MEDEKEEVKRIQHDILSPKSSMLSTRMPNPESIAHWVNRVITFEDPSKSKSQQKALHGGKHTKNAHSE